MLCRMYEKIGWSEEVSNGYQCHFLPKVISYFVISKLMSSEKKSSSKDEIPVSTKTPTAPTVANIIDTVGENTLRLFEEMAKIQPQILQSASNLQMDCIQTTRNMIQAAFAARKQIASNFPSMVPAQVSEQMARQSTEMTDNVIRELAICNQLAINALDAAKENTKIYNKAVESARDFHANATKAWNSWWTPQQQQFFRA